MSNYVYGRNDRFYLARSTSYSTLRNSGGAASVAAGDACHHKNFSVRPNRGRLAASDKESAAFVGYIDRTRQGRFSATASVSLPLYSASAAGVESDHGPILESAFGKRTIVADTSVTYGAAATGSNIKYLDEATPIVCEAWGFNPVGVRGMALAGGLVNRLRISGGQNDVALDADLIAYYAISQDRFPNAITAEKMGISAWPSEPGSQTYTGSEETGFITSLSIGGVDFTDLLRSWAITMNMNRAYRMDTCAVDGSEFFGNNPYEGMAEIMVDLSLWNCDASKLTTVLNRATNRTSQDAILQLGATAGGINTFNLNNLIKPEDDEPVTEDADDRSAVNLSGLRAQATSTSVRDEITLVQT